MITVKLKSRITFLHRANFLKIYKRGQTLPIRPRDGADARFFRLTKMAQNC